MRIAILSNKLMKSNKEATIITLANFKKQLGILKHEVLSIEHNGMSEHAKKLKRTNKQFDIIQGFSAAPATALRTILAKKAVKGSKSVHTLKSYSKQLLGSLAFSVILNFLDKVTVPTNVMKNKLIRRGVLPSKIKIIRSHIDTQKFIPMNKNKLKEKYGHKNKNIILYYGSLFKTKGPQNLVKAIKHIANKKNLKIIFAPRHEPQPEFLEIIKNINCIEIIIKDINIVEYVNMADMVVLPYINMIATEGNPSCLLESVACKTPVITTQQPEIEEIFTKEKDIIMAQPNNIPDLAKQINRLLDNKKLQIKLKENAYKKIKQFDVRTVTKKYIKLYEKLIS